jgi:hypothetical protein
MKRELLTLKMKTKEQESKINQKYNIELGIDYKSEK